MVFILTTRLRHAVRRLSYIFSGQKKTHLPSCFFITHHQGCTKLWTRTILTGRKNGFKIRPNRLSRQQGWSTSKTTHILSYWISNIIHICKFNLVQKPKICQIMSLFTRNRQSYGERKWVILTDLWGDSVHRISQAMISKIWLQSMCKTFQNNNFIIYQSSPIWNVSKLPLETSKTFTVGRQLPPTPSPPNKMADAPSGRNKQSRFCRVH